MANDIYLKFRHKHLEEVATRMIFRKNSLSYKLAEEGGGITWRHFIVGFSQITVGCYNKQEGNTWGPEFSFDMRSNTMDPWGTPTTTQALPGIHGR